MVRVLELSREDGEVEVRRRRGTELGKELGVGYIGARVGGRRGVGGYGWGTRRCLCGAPLSRALRSGAAEGKVEVGEEVRRRGGLGVGCRG